MMAVAEEKTILEIESIDFVGVPIGGEGDPGTNFETVGDGHRFFNGKNGPTQVGGPNNARDVFNQFENLHKLHSEVFIEVKLAVKKAGVSLTPHIVDVDDPSTDQFPVDGENDNTDNRGSHTPPGSQATDVLGVARIRLTTSKAPGDNFRAWVSGRPVPGAVADKLLGVQPKPGSPAAGMTGAMVFYDADGSNAYDPGEQVILTSGIISHFKVYVSKLLTVWRKLGVERDAFGAPPAGVAFDATADPGADDPSPGTPDGALPLPPIGPFGAAFEEAFIAVEELTTVKVDDPFQGFVNFQLRQDDLPYPLNTASPPVPIRGFETLADMDAYFITGGRPEYVNPPTYQAPYRGTLPEDQDYWTVYVAMVYEGPPETEFMNPGEGADNDPNTEKAEPGRMRPGPGSGTAPDFAVVYYEVIRDMSVQHTWGGMLTNDATEVVTLHEIGHQFGLTHPRPNRFPDDIMSPPGTEPDEALIPTVVPKFQPWALDQIRRHGGDAGVAGVPRRPDPHP